MQNSAAMNTAEIWQPAMQQQLFRGLLDAFSYPGRIATCASRNTPAWLALLAALVDGETTLADPQQQLDAAWWPKLEARCAAPEQAAFIVLDGSRAPELAPNLGTLEAPEAGATILLRVDAITAGATGDVHLRLSGPGVLQPVFIGVEGLHPAWIAARNDWVADFPLGIDMVLCDEHRFVALPRSTRIAMGEPA